MIRKLVRAATLFALAAALIVPIGLTLLVVAGVARADEVDDWYATVCGNDGQVFKWLARGAVGVAGAAILANFKTIQGWPVVGPLVNFVGLNWASFLRQAAQASADAAKKTSAVLFALIAAGIVLSACSQATMQRDVAKIDSVAANAKADLAALQPVLKHLCAAGSVAGGAALAIAPTAGGDAATVADIQKSVDSLGLVCADTDPANLAQDVATAQALYQRIVAKTPVVAAAAPAKT